ncbi:hypothetical protein ABK040_012210 [Willaertia magna]
MSETTNPTTTDNTFIYHFNNGKYNGWGQLTLPPNKKIKSIAGMGTESETIILTDEWKKIEYNNNKMTSDIPTPRFGQTMCVYNDKTA